MNDEAPQDRRQPLSDKERDEIEKKYRIAIDTRNFEIGLFWRRSIFFWGFIGAAFVAYAAFHNARSDVSFVIAGFGVICSLAWTLLNRGSKYWQEAWEQKVSRFEKKLGWKLFRKPEKIIHKGPWLSGEKYSVSKLAIVLSDYVLVLWVCLLVSDIINRCHLQCWMELRPLAIGGFALFTCLYAVLILAFCRKSDK